MFKIKSTAIMLLYVNYKVNVIYIKKDFQNLNLLNIKYYQYHIKYIK